MRPSSSIFSFDTLVGLPRPSRALVLTLAICGLCRLGITVASDWLDGIPASVTNKWYADVEHVLVQQSKTPPKILLMGNSLTRYGLCSDQMADAFGLERNEIANLAIPSGNVWQALVLLRRNPDRLADVEMIFFGVDPGQIHAGARARHIDHYYQFSTLREKCTVDRYGDRCRLVVDWVWPYRSQRRDVVTWLRGLHGEFPEGLVEPFDVAWLPENMAKMKARRQEFMSPPSKVAGVAGPLSGQYQKHFHEFVSICRDRGIRLVFVGSALRDSYLAAVAADPELRAGFDRFERFFDGLGAEFLDYHRISSHERLGLNSPEDFLDLCHMTPSGARKLTAAVVNDCLRQGLLPPSIAKRVPASFSPQLASGRR